MALAGVRDGFKYGDTQATAKASQRAHEAVSFEFRNHRIT